MTIPESPDSFHLANCSHTIVSEPCLHSCSENTRHDAFTVSRGRLHYTTAVSEVTILYVVIDERAAVIIVSKHWSTSRVGYLDTTQVPKPTSHTTFMLGPCPLCMVFFTLNDARTTLYLYLILKITKLQKPNTWVQLILFYKNPSEELESLKSN